MGQLALCTVARQCAGLAAQTSGCQGRGSGCRSAAQSASRPAQEDALALHGLGKRPGHGAPCGQLVDKVPLGAYHSRQFGTRPNATSHAVGSRPTRAGRTRATTKPRNARRLCHLRGLVCTSGLECPPRLGRDSGRKVDVRWPAVAGTATTAAGWGCHLGCQSA